MEYTCSCCNKIYDEIPALHLDRPNQYYDVPKDRIEKDVFLTSDSCVIANKFFFIHGLIQIPIIGFEEPLVWGTWVSLKEENFFLWQDHYDIEKRNHIGPFFGWHSAQIPMYENTLSLKTQVCIRNNGLRPLIKLEQSDHPFSIDQQHGITRKQLEKILHQCLD